MIVLDRTELSDRQIAWLPSSLRGGGILGDRLSAAIVRRHVRGLVRSEIGLARVREEQDGAVVQFRGRVRADATLDGLLHGVAGVFRRAEFLLDGRRWVHEAAVDFDVVADDEWLRVQASGARLLAPVPELVEYPRAALLSERTTASLEPLVGRLRARGFLPAREVVLRDGAEVEIVGHKGRMVDPSGEDATYRGPPQRATVRSGSAVPLLVMPGGT